MTRKWQFEKNDYLYKCHENDTKMTSKCHENDTKILKIYKNCHENNYFINREMTGKWQENDMKMTWFELP